MNRSFLIPCLRRVATVALLTAVLAPHLAFASGSWAVPRFTPTWAELERDLRLLGLRKRPTIRPIAARPPVRAVVAAPPVAATSPAGEVAATNPLPVSNTPGETNQTEQAAGTPGCKCSEPLPPPKCPELAAPPPDAATDEKGIAQPGNKKPAPKKKPPDAKKLNRKTYWWQEN